MSRLVPLALVAALLALAVDASSARAEPSFWSYAASAPDAGPGNGTSPNGPISLGMGFSGLNGDPSHPFQGSQTVPLVLVTTLNNSESGGPSFHSVQVPISVRIFALEPRAWGSLTFTAMLDGTADYSSKTSTVTLTFAGPSTQSLEFGGNRYSVSIGPFHPLRWIPFPDPGPGGVPNGRFVGSVDATVRVSPASVGDSPEPSGLALAGVGVVCVAGVLVRRRLRGVSSA
jgi:hypothetical protein